METKFLQKVQKHYYGNSDEVNKELLTNDINSFLLALKENRIFFVQDKYTSKGYNHITMRCFNIVDNFGSIRNYNAMLLALGFERGTENIKTTQSIESFLDTLLNRIKKMGFNTDFGYSEPLCF